MYKVVYGKKEKTFDSIKKAFAFARVKKEAEIWYCGMTVTEMFAKFYEGRVI